MVDTWKEVGEVSSWWCGDVIAENARREQTCDRIVGVRMKKWEGVGVVVARQKEQSGDDCVVVDDVADDNADHDVVDILTNGTIKEFDRVVEGKFDVIIIVEIEELASIDTSAIHEIVEE